jgi:hypothetical protein
MTLRRRKEIVPLVAMVLVMQGIRSGTEKENTMRMPIMTDGTVVLLMPYQMLCNDVHREGVKLSPDLASGLFCCVPLHNIWYGIVLLAMHALS